MNDSNDETPEFLTKQLVTCIGNKRSLLGFIGEGLSFVKKRLGKERLDAFDAFSGSGIVSRYLKRHCRTLHSNDLERYAELANRCYLSNPETVVSLGLAERYASFMETLAGTDPVHGFISELYAPLRDDEIKPGERVFYTNRNAAFIDTVRTLCLGLEPGILPFFVAPLIAEASVHANTSGVFKGFYKDKISGYGRFGGAKRNALSRILGDITLPFPVLSKFSCDCMVYRDDANSLAKTLPPVDVAYLDPPYNQHPYGSNYFMLNLIADYRRPEKISAVSGIPPDWNRSEYNRPRKSESSLAELLDTLNAPFIIISFNSEGFIPLESMKAMLESRGNVTVLETKYNTFRGSRNLSDRSTHVTEYLYLLER